jgi:hypothetical protein
MTTQHAAVQVLGLDVENVARCISKPYGAFGTTNASKSTEGPLTWPWICDNIHSLNLPRVIVREVTRL